MLGFDVTTTPWYACHTFEHVSLHTFQAHIFFRKHPPCGDQPQLNGTSIKEIIIHTVTTFTHTVIFFSTKAPTKNIPHSEPFSHTMFWIVMNMNPFSPTTNNYKLQNILQHIPYTTTTHVPHTSKNVKIMNHSLSW